jgi:hypothetical protein
LRIFPAYNIMDEEVTRSGAEETAVMIPNTNTPTDAI